MALNVNEDSDEAISRDANVRFYTYIVEKVA